MSEPSRLRPQLSILRRPAPTLGGVEVEESDRKRSVNSEPEVEVDDDGVPVDPADDLPS